MSDLLIKGGTVVDGTGAPAYKADVRIQDGVIAEIGDDLKPHGEKTYFADGRAGYDIQYLTRNEISADVLRQYERYLSLLQNDSTELLSTAPEHATQPQPAAE